MSFRYHIRQYLTRRAADWQTLGFTESLTDWPALNARSKFWGDDQRAAFRNWQEITDPRNPLTGRQGVPERIMLRELLRRVDMMVLYENRLDALVRLHTPYPPAKIGGAHQPGTSQNIRLESFNGPNAGLTEILIPAGYTQTAYDPTFRLSPHTPPQPNTPRHLPTPSDTPTPLPQPGLPFSLVFRADPGREPALLQIAAAYEAATASPHQTTPPSNPPPTPPHAAPPSPVGAHSRAPSPPQTRPTTNKKTTKPPRRRSFQSKPPVASKGTLPSPTHPNITPRRPPVPVGAHSRAPSPPQTRPNPNKKPLTPQPPPPFDTTRPQA